MKITVFVEDGWEGIVSALVDSTPGTTLVLQPGIFEGSDSLTLPTGISLRGAGATLKFRGDGPVVVARDVKDIDISGFTIDAREAEMVLREFPNSEPYEPSAKNTFVNWGLILLDSVDTCSVSNVTVLGCGGSTHGLFVSNCKALSVKGTDLSLTQSGMWITTSRANDISGNRCHDNTQAGITLLSSESEALEQNDCWGNDHGIVLIRDSNSPDAPSRARITGNCCHDNTQSGIGLSSSESEAMEQNDCWGNGLSGIILQRDPNSPDAASHARIIGNRCRDNTLNGIDLHSSESEALAQNDCWGNGMGIVLRRDRNSPDAPSRARITGNRCHDNTLSGISLSSSESESVDQNDCWGNELGIVLIRDLNSPDAPSRARITGNRCHDSAKYGILIASSESEALEQNDCWGNDSGIVLTRDLNSPDAPSRARITFNRCHDNTDSGIRLLSSESEALEQNDCWGNNDGIVLTRASNSPDAPSRARITGNRCHDNTQSGVLIGSSEGESVEQNDCWGNGVGIVLTRDPNSPDAPSRARITGNRCHDNTQRAFGFDEAATYELDENNYTFRNQKPSGTFSPDGRVLSDISDQFLNSDETPFETRMRYRQVSRHGDLAAQLEHASSVSDADVFARFLYGSGALHDLKRAWGIEEEASTEPEGDTQVENAVYSLKRGPSHGDGTGSTYRFLKSGSGGVRKLIWGRVAQHVIGDKPSVSLIGAFGSAGAELDTVLREAGQVNGFDVDRLEKDQIPPTGRADLLRAFQVGSIRLLPPVVVDCVKRSDLALVEEIPESGFLEPDRLIGWQAWRARVANILTTPANLLSIGGIALAAFLIAVLVGVAKSYPGPYGDPLTLAVEAINTNIADIQLLDVLLAAAGIFAGSFFLSITVLANRFLPYHLQIRPKKPDVSTDAANPARGKPWKRWISRRILRKNSVSLVVLRNILEWPEDDLDALAEIVNQRSENSSLILILECPTRSALDRVLLRPLARENNAPVPELQDVDVIACLGEEPGYLNLAKPTEIESQQRLLGIKGEKADVRLEQIRSDILSHESLPGDILPMICLGSSHYFPFSLQIRSTTAATKVSEEMKKSLSRYMSLIGKGGIGKADWLEEAAPLRDWVNEAREATCARVFLERKDRVEAYRIFGRFQQRGEMGTLVADVFEQNTDGFEDYIFRLLSCGELHAVQSARRALEYEEGAIRHPNRAIAALKGALFLRSEYESRRVLKETSDRRRQNAVVTVWRSVCSALDQLPDPQSDAEEVLQAQLYSLSLHIRGPMPEFSTLDKGSLGAASCFQSLLERARLRFSDLDRRLALERATLDLRPVLALAPEAIVKAIEADLENAFYSARSLADILENAENFEELLQNCKDHRDVPGEVLATVLSNAVRHADTDEKRLAFAQILDRNAKCIESLAPGDQPLSFNRTKTPKLQNYLSLLASWEFQEIIGEQGTAVGAFSMVELMYSSTGHIFGSGKQTDRIELWADPSDTMTVQYPEFSF